MLKTIKPWNFADFLILSIRWCTKFIYSISFSRFEFKFHSVVNRLGFSLPFTKKKKRTINYRDFFRDSAITFVFALCGRRKLRVIKYVKFGDKLNFPWYRCNIHFGPFLFCFVVFIHFLFFLCNVLVCSTRLNIAQLNQFSVSLLLYHLFLPWDFFFCKTTRFRKFLCV